MIPLERLRTEDVNNQFHGPKLIAESLKLLQRERSIKKHTETYRNKARL